MENMNNKQNSGVCQDCGHCGCCGTGHMCGCHGGGSHHLMKMILKIVIVILIFWCGFKLGLLTGIIRADYGRTGNFGGFGMMRNGAFAPNPTNLTPAQ